MELYRNCMQSLSELFFTYCRIFGGLRADIKRKSRVYLSDFKDCLHVQCIASVFFMYFACLTPIITFGGLLGAATDNNMVSQEHPYLF